MITMDNIIREGNPTLRAVAKEVDLPLTDEEKQLGQEMLEFLINSQDPELAEKYQLRGGVGLAAPQVNVSKRMFAVHIPDGPEDKIVLSTVMVNPKITRHSVQDACIAEGEGCLSVDRNVPGYVLRHQHLTMEYDDMEGEHHSIKLKDYPAMVVQHELDHLNGILFYDHINKENPFKLSPDAKILGV